ncbi:MAG: FxSxx-COOH system tetratricopeptide repeat protein [Candidatus Tyrphobacter sp.]
MEHASDSTAQVKTLFISRAGADAHVAAAIGSILEAAGYPVILQQWDFANRNFMERMHAALAQGARVIALLSPEYLRSEHCQAEWQNAIAQDPLNKESRLILLRVAECEPQGLLSGLAYWDLVPIRDDRTLLGEIVCNAVREGRHDVALGGPCWRPPRSIVDVDAIRPVPNFSGRESELMELTAAFASGSSVAVVHGLGGIGKSSVAREYACRSRERYSVIWWLNAQTEDGIIDGLLRLGTLFVRGLDQLQDRRAAAARVIGTMFGGSEKPALLIFDNLEDERLLRSWQPAMGAQILVTSRNAAWSSTASIVPLRPWSIAQASDYVRRESRRADLTEDDAAEIAEVLGMLPLALAHAAAYLRATRVVTPRRYLERITEHMKSAPRGAEYPRSVFATFTTAIDRAEQEAPGATAVVCFAACFAPEDIPDELFRQAIDVYPDALRPVQSEPSSVLDLRSAVGDDLHLDEALGALDRLSLLSFAQTKRAYSIHRLVKRVGHDLAGGDALVWNECAVAAANAAFPHVEFATWTQCARFLPHARAALRNLPEDAVFLPAANLAHGCAVYLTERAEFAEAEWLAARSLAIRETAVGAEHADVAESLESLARLYFRQGRYGDAERLFLRMLAIREKALGSNDLGVARALNGLALLYDNQGRYAEANALHDRALAIRERVFGPDHADVAASLNNLARSFHHQGRYGEAESLFARALAIKEKALGPDHPDVAYGLDSLAVVYESEARYAEAEPLQVRALAIWERALGNEHPNVAMALFHLAVLYDDLGRYEEAEPLHLRAQAIRENVLGPDHPDVADSLYGSAVLYEHQGRHDEAETLHIRAVAVWEKAFGSDYIDIAQSLATLASMYQRQERNDEAEIRLVRALAIREKALGSDHALTRSTRERLRTVRQMLQ